MQDMGIFRTSIRVGGLSGGALHIAIEVMVDTGSEYNWVPSAHLESLGIVRARRDRFETADGRVLERDVGFAMIYAGGRSAAAAVVFGEPGDMTLLGAIGLESLNLRVDLGRKELVPAGPVPAAAISATEAKVSTAKHAISQTAKPIKAAGTDIHRGGAAPVSIL